MVIEKHLNIIVVRVMILDVNILCIIQNKTRENVHNFILYIFLCQKSAKNPWRSWESDQQDHKPCSYDGYFQTLGRSAGQEA